LGFVSFLQPKFSFGHSVGPTTSAQQPTIQILSPLSKKKKIQILSVSLSTQNKVEKQLISPLKRRVQCAEHDAESTYVIYI
jgi:hypothetical protein